MKSNQDHQPLNRLNLEAHRQQIERDVRRTGVVLATNEEMNERGRVEAMKVLAAAPLPPQLATSLTDRMLYHSNAVAGLARAKAEHVLEVARQTLGAARETLAKMARPKPWSVYLPAILVVLAVTFAAAWFSSVVMDDSFVAIEVSNLGKWNPDANPDDLMAKGFFNGTWATRALVGSLYAGATLAVFMAAGWGIKLAFVLGEVLIIACLAVVRFKISSDIVVNVGIGAGELGVALVHLVITTAVARPLIRRSEMRDALKVAERTLDLRKLEVDEADKQRQAAAEKEDESACGIAEREHGWRRHLGFARVIAEHTKLVERDVRTAMAAEAVHDPAIDIYRTALGRTDPTPSR